MKKVLLVFTALVMIMINAACSTSEPVANATEDRNVEVEQNEKENEVENKGSDIKPEDTEKDETDESNMVKATVTRVIDGDSLDVELENGKEETLRLLLVDTPETVHPSKPVMPVGKKASNFAKEYLTGKKVKLEFDGNKRDKYDRLLVYLWVNGENFNQLLLEKGLARLAYVYDPPYTHHKEFTKAQNRAKDKEIGIWSFDGYVTEDGFNLDVMDENKQNEETNDNEDNTAELKYDPNGVDRDCGDFEVWENAQAFFEAAGEGDPHRLDRDGNGIACEGLK